MVKGYKFHSSSKGKSDSIVEKGYPKCEKENVYINGVDYFESVQAEVWNFHIGGFLVLHKWLMDRRERALSDEDLLFYWKVIDSLKETIAIMREVDDVLLQDETVWQTIVQMAELFQKLRSTINEHILNIFEEEELKTVSSIRKIKNSDFSTKPTNFYNLDLINSVGYKVKSRQGTKFRIWATQRLKEYTVIGFVLNDDHFKRGNSVNFAETMAQQHKPMYMADWINKLVEILKLNGREFLIHAGKESHEMALEKSNTEYEKYIIVQRKESHENSLKEIEADIKKLKRKTKSK